MNRLLLPSLGLLLSTFATAQDVDHLALGKMWTFENPPLAYLEKEYGFKPDEKWLDSLRLGALRLGERENPWCSASFVSPKGLIMTNHHCVREQVAQVQGDEDWVKNGFAATALADEVRIPGLTVQQLVAQEDITADVGAGIGDDDDDVTIAKKRDANIERITADADAAHPGHMHQVVALYQGAVYQLYRYRVWDDLRLVVAPHLQTAHFGGDPDNFTYPRWGIDFSFVRAYEDDAPADTSAHYFKWRQQGALEGDLVFIPGNPGNTNRQMTFSQLMVQRDVEYPMTLEVLDSLIRIVGPYKDQPGILTQLLSWQNGQKSIAGTLRGLQDAELIARKEAHESHFRKAIEADAELAKEYGSIWREIDALTAKQREVLPKGMFYAPSYSGVIERGLAIARSLDETVAEDERAESRQQALMMQVQGSPLTRELLADHFVRAARWLGENDPYVAAVKDGNEDWEGALRALRGSKLGQGRFVRELLEAEDAAEKWSASDDIGVRVARVLWPLIRDVEKAQELVDSGLAKQGTRLGRALHAVYGTNVSPDATMTLRFSDGVVKGYEYNGTLAPWATTFYGLYARGVEFGNEYPFDIPQPWLAAEDEVDLKKRVCFASTNDIVGGNSGSCVVDKDLQIVGLVFDGNIESLANDFYYTQQVARAVSVHTDAILEALSHVYGMGRVVDELRAGAQ